MNKSGRNYWNVIYQSMTPFEKGTFNARQRKEKEIAKTSGEIGPTYFQDKLPKKNKPANILAYIDTMKKRYGE